METLETAQRKIYLDFACELAREAGNFIRPIFCERSFHVSEKVDASPLTEADTGAEALIRKRISERYPEHGIFGEEMKEKPSHADSPFRWVIDPIDGTKAFISGVPLFTVLIALEFKGQAVVGVIYQPILDQLVAGDGFSAFYNGVPTHARECADLADATLLTTDARNPLLTQGGADWQELVSKVKLYRTWGDAYGYLLLAAGYADIMADPILEHWDKAALFPILTGAGIRFSDWTGNPAESGRSLIAAPPRLHESVLKTIYPEKHRPIEGGVDGA